MAKEKKENILTRGAKAIKNKLAQNAAFDETKPLNDTTPAQEEKVLQDVAVSDIPQDIQDIKDKHTGGSLLDKEFGIGNNKSTLRDKISTEGIDTSGISGDANPSVIGGQVETVPKEAPAGNQSLAKTIGGATDSITPENAYNVDQNAVDSITQSGQDSYNVAKSVLDENNPYKTGADYVKYLWSQGGKGKAAAIGNVLGNLLSGAGNAMTGEGDKGTQWNEFVNNYQRQEREGRETAMKDAQEAVKTANANKAARTELVKSINQAISQGKKLSESEMAAINAWQRATTPSSTLDKALAVIINKLGLSL